MTYYLQVLSVLKVSDKVEQIIAYHQQQLGDLGPNQLILEEVKRLGEKKIVGKVTKKESFPKKSSLWIYYRVNSSIFRYRNTKHA